MTKAQAEQLFRQAGAPLPDFMEAPKLDHKYSARRKQIGDIVFDSCLEARAYQILRQWAEVGAISGLELQPEFLLQAGYRDNDGKWRRPIKYRADFRYWDKSRKCLVTLEIKGFKTASWRIKEKLFRGRFRDETLEIWGRDEVNART